VTLRNSLTKIDTKSFEKSEDSDDKVKKLEIVNQSLNANLEEAILKLEDHYNTFFELNEKFHLLLEKLGFIEQISDKNNAVDVVKI
jgi:hypothetical protein